MPCGIPYSISYCHTVHHMVLHMVYHLVFCWCTICAPYCIACSAPYGITCGMPFCLSYALPFGVPYGVCVRTMFRQSSDIVCTMFGLFLGHAWIMFALWFHRNRTMFRVRVGHVLAVRDMFRTCLAQVWEALR